MVDDRLLARRLPTRRHLTLRHPAVCAVLVIAALAGCGTPPSGGASAAQEASAATADVAAPEPLGPPSGEVSPADPDPDVAFSTADVEFLATMTSHHAAALQMLELAEHRATSPDVRAFTARTRLVQQSEVDRMRRWLSSLGIDPSTAGGAHDHSGTGVPDVDDLRALSGAAFDRRLLDVLTSHSITAAALAADAAKDGFNSGVRRLAVEIVARERTELETLRRLDRA